MVVSEGFPAAHFCSCLPRRELMHPVLLPDSAPCLWSRAGRPVWPQHNLRSPSQRGLDHVGRGLPLTERALWSHMEESGAP